MNLFDDIENEIKKDSEPRVSRVTPRSSLISPKVTPK
jgi:hypothetical protein